MTQFISAIALVVSDYDEAIEFYTGVLNFTLKTDDLLPDGKRWVIVSPPGAKECTLLLARAANKEQALRIGNQTGGRVFLFLNTNDFESDYAEMKRKGVRFLESPRNESYGRVVVFTDPFGNKWDLIEPA